MFSALKKLTGRSGGPENSTSSNPPPTAYGAGLSVMSTSLQKKFARGVHYNSKVMHKVISFWIVVVKKAKALNFI